jgi:hypothetical protein
MHAASLSFNLDKETKMNTLRSILLAGLISLSTAATAVPIVITLTETANTAALTPAVVPGLIDIAGTCGLFSCEAVSDQLEFVVLAGVMTVRLRSDSDPATENPADALGLLPSPPGTIVIFGRGFLNEHAVWTPTAGLPGWEPDPAGGPGPRYIYDVTSDCSDACRFVPEPSPLMLLLIGAAGWLGLGRRSAAMPRRAMRLLAPSAWRSGCDA